MRIGQKVKFVNPEKYDDKEHVILNVQKLPNDVCCFLHYWSWIDEDELILVEDKIDMKVGDKVGYKDTALNGTDTFTIKEIRLTGEGKTLYGKDEVHYVEGGFDSLEDLLVLESAKKEDNVVAPAHYTTTKISALDVVNDWELDFYLGNALKYMKRYKLKGNPIQDLEKAVQYLQLKIQVLKDEQTK